MKIFDCPGISYLERLNGSEEWYWGMDYTSGDLYEAEELFRGGHAVSSNQLIFIHYPDGRLVRPVPAIAGRYFGRPACYNGMLIILLADFPAGVLQLLQYDDEKAETVELFRLELSAVRDCYNLMPELDPLCLIRQGSENVFQLLWPEQASFPIDPHESFCCRDGSLLYFSRWYEDPDYREELVVRRLDGEIVERRPGSLMELPDGQKWLLG